MECGGGGQRARFGSMAVSLLSDVDMTNVIIFVFNVIGVRWRNERQRVAQYGCDGIVKENVHSRNAGTGLRNVLANSSLFCDALESRTRTKTCASTSDFVNELFETGHHRSAVLGTTNARSQPAPN